MNEFIEKIRSLPVPDGEEACGFVVRMNGKIEVIQAKNIADDPSSNAIPDGDTIRMAHESDGILYAFHTHADSDSPGPLDQKFCDAFGAPYLIITPSKSHILQPTPPWHSLLGYAWSWDRNCVWACAEFSSRIQGLSLSYWPLVKESDWPPKHDFFYGVHDQAGFSVVEDEIRFGDWISFRVPSLEDRVPSENHIAVSVGNGDMFHLPASGVSVVEPIEERIGSYLARVYRWKELL